MGHLLARFERGDVDVALTTPEAPAAGLHTRPLFDETYVCVLREGHPAAAEPLLTLDAFCRLDHALVSFAGGFSGVTDEALATLGLSRRVALSASSFMLLLGILRTTDLTAVLPHRLLAEAEGLALREPPLDIPGFTKVLAWHERSQSDAARAWARDILLRTCGSPLQTSSEGQPPPS